MTSTLPACGSHSPASRFRGPSRLPSLSHPLPPVAPSPGRACRHIWSGRRKCACVELRDRGTPAGGHLGCGVEVHPGFTLMRVATLRFSSGVLSRSWHNSYSSLAVFVARLTLFTKINNEFVCPDPGTDEAFPRKAQHRACHTAGA